MPSKSGIAILGAGIFAKEAHLPALAVLKDAAPALKVVYSRSETSAKDLAGQAQEVLNLPDSPGIYHDGGAPSTGLDALLQRDDISAVIIVMPITLQPGLVIKALEAGKHVLSEKPIAPDVAGGLDLIQQYKTRFKPKGLVWRVAENFEAEPAVQFAAEVIRSGRIGDVTFFKAVAINHIDKDSKWYKTAWRTVPDYQGGFLLDGGVHTIAVLRTILPKPLTHLSAFPSLNKDYLKPHDTIHAIIKAEGSFNGTLEMTWAFPTEKKPQADQFVVTGTRGWLSINSSWSPPVFRVTIASIGKGGEGGKEDVVEEIVEKPMKGVETELKSFFDAISGNNETLPFGDPDAALQDVAVIQAALNSDGHLVDLVRLQSTGR
ncbi:NAD(P)-binding protein [Coprinopsis marcescibilis]|uniref:NAD(P)-binding protein n=1 Tax=Coprinopsis marcescibilis TaxID=230819 RepID=A0A5C3KPK4_COPMA|nr:NAD(P)-binding protein [Coprinopsis marcescibilis]